MHILITDYYSAANRGDAAILEGVMHALRHRYPSATIDVLTEHPTAAELVHGIDAIEQRLAGFHWRLSKRNLARAYLATAATLGQPRPPAFTAIARRSNLEAYHEADLVVSTGGHHLTDYYFPDKVGMLWELYYLGQLDIPFVLYAQTLGPFERRLYRELTSAVLDKAAVILTRDDESRRILEALGISAPIHTTADAAFAMDLDTVTASPLDHLSSVEVLPSKHETTVSISVREWRHTDATTSVDAYLDTLATYADWLVDTERNVIFASTCTSLDGYHNDDRLTAARIVDRMEYGDRDEVAILSGEYTPSGLVDIYREVDLHVGMRMHSNILAMLAHTPVVAIQYQFKTRGMMRQFGLDEAVLDVNDLDLDSLRAATTTAFANRDERTAAIREHLPEVRRTARQTAEFVREYVEPGADVLTH